MPVKTTVINKSLAEVEKYYHDLCKKKDVTNLKPKERFLRLLFCENEQTTRILLKALFAIFPKLSRYKLSYEEIRQTITNFILNLPPEEFERVIDDISTRASFTRGAK